MTKFNKLQTVLQANSVYTLYVMMGFHCTMTVGKESSLHQVDVSVFWNDDNQRELVGFKSRGLLRDGDAYEECYHRNPDLSGGWTTFTFYFE